MNALDDILRRLDALPDQARAAVIADAVKATDRWKFVPNPGPQTEAWFCPADVMLYGGQAAGGKTGLLCGLALEAHRASLLLRRRYMDLQGGGGLIDELLKLYGSRDGFNGSPPATLRTSDGRVVTFGGAANVGDEMAYAGRARDFLGIDEAVQFAALQVRVLMGWVRTTVAGQRCRTVLATNPPTSAEGEWLIGMFRPWLDVTHPKPAQPGELRWYVTAPDGTDLEVDGPEPVEIDGQRLDPQSRTFIPARLIDNPFIDASQYRRTLDSLPEPIRSALRDGNFMLARQDAPNQVIPTAWVQAAQARWTPEPPEHAPMSALGVDIAQGGVDRTVLAPRWDAWFGPLVTVPGKDTPDGPTVAGLVLQHRRNNATVILDMGGGWGGSTFDHLKQNNIECSRYVGSAATSIRTSDQTLGFVNVRTAAYWRFREALDPSQDGGSPIALPPDPELLADLTATTFDVTPRGIRMQSKEDIVLLLGRSPDKGDAVVMSWWGGPKLRTHGEIWRRAARDATAGRLRVNLGHVAARRSR